MLEHVSFIIFAAVYTDKSEEIEMSFFNKYKGNEEFMSNFSHDRIN